MNGKIFLELPKVQRIRNDINPQVHHFKTLQLL